MSSFSECNWSQSRNNKKQREKEKTVKEKLSDMISLANSHCSKIHSNIKTTHNTRKTPSFVLQLLENRIKNIHVFKEAFLFLFFNPSFHIIWRHLSSFWVWIRRFCYFFPFLLKNFLFKTGIADFGDVTDMFVLISAEWSRWTRHTQIRLFAFGCAFLA